MSILLLDVNSIIVSDRIRQTGPKPARIEEMLEDIRGSNGLLQPGVAVKTETEDWKLVIGETRLRAFQKHYKESDEEIRFGASTIPHGKMPFIDFMTLNDVSLLRAEISENVIRTQLSWQEEADALARLYKMEEAQGAQSVKAVAQKLSGASGKSEHSIASAINRSLIVADHLEDPEVRKASTPKEAYNIIRSKTLAELRRADAEERLQKQRKLSTVSTTREAENGEVPETSPAKLHNLLHGDCEDILPNLPDETYSLVICDPPYGIDADDWTFKSAMHRHKYDDSFEASMERIRVISEHSYRLTTSAGNLFMFCSPDLWHIVALEIEKAGWVLWPRPVVWIKGNEGMRPWGQTGFGYGYETLVYATKPGAGLIQTSMDFLTHYKPRKRFHAAQKPDDLYANLMKIGALPGDFILDPCCGSGTVFRAATLEGMFAHGIERDDEMAALASHYTTGEIDPNTGELGEARADTGDGETSLTDL